MEFYEVINKRRSVRKYTNQKVEAEKINRALDAAILAPNSSNMQTWEFYWVRSPNKKKQVVEACLSQPAAATAQELIVCVSRIDTWNRNRKLVIQQLKSLPDVSPSVFAYYEKLMPIVYYQDFFGLVGPLKKFIMSVTGLFRPSPREPAFRSDLFETVSKSAALGCENLMLALTAEGLGSCPMEGLDSARVKRCLGLGRNAHVVMVVSAGYTDLEGIYGERMRLDRSLFVKEV